MIKTTDNCPALPAITTKPAFLLALLLSAFTCFGQYEQPRKVYTLKDMNVYGKVKQITEMRETVDKKGNLKPGEKRWKYIYQFDENGNLLKMEDAEIADVSLASTKIYYYTAGKLAKIATKIAFSYPYTRTFHYSANGIDIKDEDGNTRIKLNLKDGLPVEEIEYYIREGEQPRASYSYSYEYDNKGLVVKKTYKNISYKNYMTSTLYENTPKGNIKKKEEYNNDGKLEWITDFKYTYTIHLGDHNENDTKNWSECNTAFYQPGKIKEAAHTRWTRTFEYY